MKNNAWSKEENKGGLDFVSLFFFFSSRRRHTRFDCDWSSDVCSSDLRAGPLPTARQAQNVRVTTMVIRIVIALAALLASPSALAKELNSIGITVGSLGDRKSVV